MAKILIVEDDAALAELVQQALTQNRFAADVAADGKEGLLQVKSLTYDLVILDWELPNVSGIEILKEMRASGMHTPVLMLTGRKTMPDKEMGFNTGADDYVAKPCNVKEVVLRVQALLRRPKQVKESTVTLGPFYLDPESFTLKKNDTIINLTPAEFGLLEFFLRHPDEYFTVEALLQRIWQTDTKSTGDAIKACISRLRKKIDEPGSPSFVQNVYGVGYKFALH